MSDEKHGILQPLLHLGQKVQKYQNENKNIKLKKPIIFLLR